MIGRKEFFQKLEPFVSPSTLLTVQMAYTMAKFSHRFQVRKEQDEFGRPVRYFEHVKRVALTLMDDAQIFDTDLIVSALLHDGIEDTRDITPAMLEHAFGSNVARIVKLLSKVPKEGYLDRLIICKDWQVLAVKAADRLDNLRSLGSTSLAFQRKQIAETIDHYYPLFANMSRFAPANRQDNLMQLWQKIDFTVSGHVFREPTIVVEADRPSDDVGPPLPTYHEILNRLCVEFRIPGSPDLDEALADIKKRLRTA